MVFVAILAWIWSHSGFLGRHIIDEESTQFADNETVALYVQKGQYGSALQDCVTQYIASGLPSVNICFDRSRAAAKAKQISTSTQNSNK